MATLEIANLSEAVYRDIERLARLAGRSVPEQAAEMLSRAVGSDGSGEDPESALLEAIRREREELARKGVFITDADIREGIEWGRFAAGA